MQQENTPTAVVFEIVGPDAGKTVRMGGFEFQNGEIHVPAANVAELEPKILATGARRKRVRLNRKK